MIKSPAFTRLLDFFAWAEDNKVLEVVNNMENGPTSFPFIIIIDEHASREEQQQVEFIYSEDFDGFEEYIFMKFTAEYYPTFYEMIEKPKIMRKV